jgi:DNA-binding MarR family transcriptional regulator
MMLASKLYVKLLYIDNNDAVVSFGTAMRDHVDEILRQWDDERPDLDTASLAVLSRVTRLGKYVAARFKTVLAPLGLEPWSFDVLAALRRQGEPFMMSPTELRRTVILTSGAMTNRIDRLEQRALVERVADPSDRRGVQVHLTQDGLALIDKAFAARLCSADEIVSHLSLNQRDQLASLLRKLLVAATSEVDGSGLGSSG